MRVILEDIKVPDTGLFDLSINATAEMRISAARARQLVGIFTGNHISTQIHGITPEELVLWDERVYWRVPVVFSASIKGQLGRIGTIDVDTETGELTIYGQDIEETHIEEMLTNARRLAASPASITEN